MAFLDWGRRGHIERLDGGMVVGLAQKANAWRDKTVKNESSVMFECLDTVRWERK